MADELKVEMISRTAKGFGLFLNNEPYLIAGTQAALAELEPTLILTEDVDIRPVTIKWGPRKKRHDN